MEEEIYFLSPDAVVGLWLARQTATGRMSAQLADEFWLNYQRGVSQLVTWATSKERLRDIATWASTINDMDTLRRLILEVGVTGTLYFKSYGGKLHVIFKGRAGLRQLLNAPKYGVQNSKVVKMGIGRHGVARVVRSGAIVTFFLLTSYRFLEYELLDGTMLQQLALVTGIAADLAMIAASGVLATVLGTMAVGLTSFVIGPLVVVIGVSVLLSAGDWYFGWSDQIQAALSDALIAAGTANARQAIERAQQEMARGSSGLRYHPFSPFPLR
jgi:hypothetical protein